MIAWIRAALAHNLAAAGILDEAPPSPVPPADIPRPATPSGGDASPDAGSPGDPKIADIKAAAPADPDWPHRRENTDRSDAEDIRAEEVAALLERAGRRYIRPLHDWEG